MTNELIERFLMFIQKVDCVCKIRADKRKKGCSASDAETANCSSCISRPKVFMNCSLHFQFSILSAVRIAQTSINNFFV